jgi:hypothetical protein
MNINIPIDDKLRHVLIIGESKPKSSKIIQELILDDINNNVGAVYITTSQIGIESILERSNNNPNIIQFMLTNPINIAEEIYRIKELNLRALMDNGKVFVIEYNASLTSTEDIIKLNKLILNNIIEHAFARIDGKEYDKNHDLIDKNLTHVGGLKRKPFFIYIEDCEQYLDKELLVALMEIRLKKVGMIFGLISNGAINNIEHKIDSIISNTGSVFILKSNPKDLVTLDLSNKSTMNIKSDIVNLKPDEFIARIMNQGIKGNETKLTL